MYKTGKSLPDSGQKFDRTADNGYYTLEEDKQRNQDSAKFEKNAALMGAQEELRWAFSCVQALMIVN